ncbi:MAG: NUDIX domain-containing protein [Candidatus Pacebacteria bacterium]|nr:NUDIX domain-containing protein [Candidatus Paceibacterota bacterium]MCD8508322.1 NUDIX domain-containing protein [Candidatus Paceibacterota bacterium]MCD8528052.1 NUDIX domain-containing protein [Candidatus Paceibacterota bacterium]MCD8564060.1 NUDIX domain-containing protein [Candidatus Paceibacterota bacterium]
MSKVYIPTQAAGALIWYMADNVPRFLLIQSRTGNHWAFPKGHVDAGESLIDCAIREVREEVGIDIANVMVSSYIITDTYHYPSWNHDGEHILKSVAYFPCPFDNKPDVSRQFLEVKEYRWCTPDEALELITHPHTRDMLAHFLEVYPVSRV